MSLNKQLMERFDKETGGVAIYKAYGTTYHTLKYVDWLENLAVTHLKNDIALSQVRDVLQANLSADMVNKIMPQMEEWAI